MEIISHRGYWLTPEEKNAVVAFERSFALSYGTETDVRDYAGRLLISHDPPRGDELDLDGLLRLAGPGRPTLAINVKADGLAAAIGKTMRAHDYERWFVFDMSVPDTRQQLTAGNPVFVRMSEYEQHPPFLDAAAGIWLDAFEDDGWRVPALAGLLSQGKRICLVSPELHRRAPHPFWMALRDAGLHIHDRVTLCTDVPEEATLFFQEA